MMQVVYVQLHFAHRTLHAATFANLLPGYPTR